MLKFDIDVNIRDDKGITFIMNTVMMFSEESFEFTKILLKEKKGDANCLDL